MKGKSAKKFNAKELSHYCHIHQWKCCSDIVLSAVKKPEKNNNPKTNETAEHTRGQGSS